ncbi:MAG: VWA domain-containing protein [Lachnospiraceae bacterium]|nr:VWA domain-containing protein [Lachnospiraceae bacterium]
MELLRGMRDKLDKYVDTGSEICISMSVEGSSVYDFCCFGVDKAGKLSDDRYMIFYNQVSSPGREIQFVPGNHFSEFHIRLSELPTSIERLVFTASIDGNGTMGEITKHNFYLSQNNTTQISMELAGDDFNKERAIIAVELYQKDGWRIAAVANGFNGGLSALLKSFGGEEILPDVSAPDNTSQNQERNPVTEISSEREEKELIQDVMGKIRLSKDKVNLEKHVVNLSKCIVDLSKKSGVALGSTKAKVVVVLDYSGSMSRLYSNGTVQRTLNRLVPLGLTFDDNGAIDIYLFQNDFMKLADLNLSNYENYVQHVIKASGYRMGGTKYAPVLKAIIEGSSHKKAGFLGFSRKSAPTEAIVDDGDATFILFITDGENTDRDETDNIIRKSSGMNVFIQFIGIGSESFRYLRKLDDMAGRVRDNTGFTKMKDLDRADDNELYTNVLDQFAKWLRGQQ